MSNFPKVINNFQMERIGVNKINELCCCYNLIFRETQIKNVGIDGYIEYINESGEAIGRLVAVQIKSGDSYLNDSGNCWKFYIDKKHRSYWESFPLPVILLVYRPSDDVIYHIDLRQHLLNADNNESYIVIPKSNILNNNVREVLFETIGNLSKPFLEIEQVFDLMISTRCNNSTFNVSYFDLFINGLTGISRQLLFDISFIGDIAEFNNNSEFGLGLGSNDYSYLYDYVNFIISQNIARVDFSDFLIDWNDRQLLPSFLAPLTRRGNLLLEYIRKKESILCDNILPLVSLTSERTYIINSSHNDFAKMEKAAIFTNKILNNTSAG